jgi:hypothetical protein
MKVFVVSDLAEYALAHAYLRAMRRGSITQAAFDVATATSRHVRLGRFGRTLHRFLPVEAWARKGNRDMVVACTEFAPDLVMVFGNAPLLYGALALLRTSTRAKIVLYWPDTLLNLSENQIHAAGLYDCVATYSAATMDAFHRMGFRSTLWLPFAADVEFLGTPTSFDGPFEHDISFAGGWRPEREAVLRAIRRRFPQARIAIHGNSWHRFCKDPALRACCSSKEVVGMAYGDLIRRSRLTLNQIDHTNYPGANMRFFEVPAAGGLQLSSECPEMEQEMRDGQHLLYFRNEDDMAEKIDWAMSRPIEAANVRHSGHLKVMESHTYRRRINGLLEHLGMAQ